MTKSSGSSFKLPSALTKIAIGLGLILLGFSYFSRIPFPDLLQQIQESYFFPYINPVPAGQIDGINFHVLVYQAILILTLALSLIRMDVLSRRRKTPRHFLKYCALFLLQGTWIVLFLLVTIQTINNVKIFHAQVKNPTLLSIQKRLSNYHGLPYHFAKYCRDILPGRHRCQFITDGDLSQNQAMLQHRTMAYFLLPTIDIRGIYRDQPVDCLIFYEKVNAAKAVPPEFKIQGRFNSLNLLAVRKFPEVPAP